MHAKEILPKATQSQNSELNLFFKTNHFSRFATLIRTDSKLSSPISRYRAVYAGSLGHIEKIASAYPIDSIALIFESSDRSDKLVEEHFSSMQITKSGILLPYEPCFMERKRNEPGLEVADFVMNTAGRHVNHSIRTGKREANDRFKSIFQSVPKEYVSYLEIDSAFVG